ncbi:MAG: hypothetical protein IPK07_16200 [Deltaproteobacteria bacterium]|nr:hypothetical protein [Deltaproteobacteria bacterium]
MDIDLTEARNTPTRERRLRPWLAPLALTLLIWTTLPLVSGVRRWIKNNLGEWPLRYAATVLFVALAIFAIHHFVRRARVRHARFWRQLALLASLYALSLVIYGHEAVEQLHLFEYGLLAVLVLRALPPSLQGLPRQASAFAITGVIGLVDEGLQGLINRHYDAMLAALTRTFDASPDELKNVFFIRFFDWRDVRLNFSSALLGLWAWALWRSANAPPGEDPARAARPGSG